MLKSVQYPEKQLRVDELGEIADRLVVGPETAIEPKVSQKSPVISSRAITNIVVRLLEGKRVRRSFPGWGRIHIDRQLPFLIIYRRPVDRSDVGTARLVMGEASYLTAPGDRKLHESLSSLIRAVATNLGSLFGAFLVIEIWAQSDRKLSGNPEDYKPGFRVLTNKSDSVTPTVQVLERNLRRITTKRQKADVEVVATSKIHPPEMRQLISTKAATELQIHNIGIEVKPVYQDAGHEEFPLVRRALHRGLARTIRRSVYEFTKTQTTHRPSNYQSLGPRSFVKAVWHVDQQLADVSNQFDFLLSITPTNTDSAWAAFKKKRFQTAPQFTYRPLPVEPSLLKRSLYNIRLERISDPVLSQLFRAQQSELDRKLTMLEVRGSDNFLYNSMMLYGQIDDELSAAAEAILYQFAPRSRDESKCGFVDAETFAKRAEIQIEKYREDYPKLTSKVIVRADTTGLMVSRGNLLIGKSVRTPESRVDALIAHEVGTHIVTYFNGHAQPFRQLYVGLPNYDELQEGLAVLAEYLVGGLSKPRLRMLAARVIAAKSIIDHGSFVDVFRLLNERYRFEQRTAFNIAMRIFRSGGYTKDAVYLRGLLNTMKYLEDGGEIDPLLIGKFGLEHLPIIKELQAREVLQPAAIRPHYLDEKEVQARLKTVRDGASVLDLVEKKE